MTDHHTVTVSVDVDTEELEKVIGLDLMDRDGGTMTDEVEVDLDELLDKAVTHVGLEQSDAPNPVPMAIEYAIEKKIY